MKEAWRPVIAALANPDLQPILGRMLLGMSAGDAMAGMAASKQRRLVGALVRSGLIASADPEALLEREVFSRLLALHAQPKREGIHRFLRDGRIERYPANLDEREQLLVWITEQVLEPGESADEATINARLEPFSADTAVLRRYLIDFSLLERRRDGSRYFRPATADPPSRSSVDAS